MTDKRKCTHKKKPTKKQENPHKPPQPYKSLLLMRLRTAKKKKKDNWIFDGSFDKNDAHREEKKQLRQSIFCHCVCCKWKWFCHVDGMEQGWKVDMNLQHIGRQKGTCMKIKRHSGYWKASHTLLLPASFPFIIISLKIFFGPPTPLPSAIQIRRSSKSVRQIWTTLGFFTNDPFFLLPNHESKWGN